MVRPGSLQVVTAAPTLQTGSPAPAEEGATAPDARRTTYPAMPEATPPWLGSAVAGQDSATVPAASELAVSVDGTTGGVVSKITVTGADGSDSLPALSTAVTVYG